MSLRWPPKDPDEVLDFDINWTLRLYTKAELDQYTAAVKANPSLKAADPATVVVPADTIVSSTFTLPAGLTADSSTYTSRVAKVWLSGGVDGVTYAAQNRVKTFAGRTMDQTVKVKIKTK